jgi:hypothetical protein
MNTRVLTFPLAVVTHALATLALAGGAATMTPPPGAVVGLPDVAVTDITFQVVEKTTWGNNQPCTIYNLTPTVKNEGKGDAGPFNVLIERDRGAGGAFEKACETCLLAVRGLEAGETATLEPRQFNNCGNSWNTFRVSAEIRDAQANNNSRTESFVLRLAVPRTAVSHLPAHPTPATAPKGALILYGQLADGRWVAVTRGSLYWTGEAGLLALCADGTYHTMAGDILHVRAHKVVLPGEIRAFNPQPEPPARQLLGTLADGRRLMVNGQGAFLLVEGKPVPPPDGTFELRGGGSLTILHGQPTSKLLPKGFTPTP